MKLKAGEDITEYSDLKETHKNHEVQFQTPQIVEMRQTGPLGLFCWFFVNDIWTFGALASSLPVVLFSLGYQCELPELPPSTHSYGITTLLGISSLHNWYWVIFIFFKLLRGASLSSGTDCFIGFRRQWKDGSAVLWCVHKNEINPEPRKRQQCCCECFQAI